MALKAVVKSGMETPFDIRNVPDHVIDHFARATLEAVRRYFEIPGVKEKYEAWLVEYNKREKKL